MNWTSLKRRQLMLYLGLGITAAGVATGLKRSSETSQVTPTASSELPTSGRSESAIAAAPAGKLLPEFQGITHWLNSSPLKVSDLKGSIVLVQIWTLGCINCQRTLP